MTALTILGHSLLSAGIHYSVLHHCSWDQPQPIHLHRQIYGCIIPSPRPYEDYSSPDFRIYILWERGPQHTSSCRHDHCNNGNGLVWQCLLQAGRERAAQLLYFGYQIPKTRCIIRVLWCRWKGIEFSKKVGNTSQNKRKKERKKKTKNWAS